MLMGGWANGQVCADGERGPQSAWGIFFTDSLRNSIFLRAVGLTSHTLFLLYLNSTSDWFWIAASLSVQISALLHKYKLVTIYIAWCLSIVPFASLKCSRIFQHSVPWGHSHHTGASQLTHRFKLEVVWIVSEHHTTFWRQVIQLMNLLSNDFQQLVRAECMRCPWLQAETKLATILGMFFFFLLLVLLPPLLKPQKGLS